ncbi:glycosyltransferase family 4 protein [Glaciibacter sp. 2TAF33]|uniref:glycosyltransferase family 4 protein n=1 Tax=Glaciibacter sp. 2TAF33 TaxID=3233015 RepID=UPI003F8E9FD8
MSGNDQPIRIAQFANTIAISDGGPARNSFELNLSLNARPGVTANLFWFRGTERESVLSSVDESQLPSPGPRHIVPRLREPGRILPLVKVFNEITNSDFVIIHGYYIFWIPLVVLLSMLARKPVAVMPHGALTTRQQRLSRPKKALFEWVAGWLIRRYASTFVTGSESEAEAIRARFPSSSAQTAGVGTTMQPPANYAGLHAPIRLLSVSRISKKKRIDMMLNAVALLRSENIECELTIAGQGDPGIVKSLRDQVHKLDIEDCVKFVGQIDGTAKRNLLWNSDIFLLPSDDENFGIALAEALAHGLPAVASQHVAAASVIRNNPGGRIMHSHSPEALAHGIVEISASPLFSQARMCAFAAAERSFSWGQVAESWVSILNATRRP